MSALSKILLGFLTLAVLLAGLVWLLPAERRTTLLSTLSALQGKFFEAGAQSSADGNEEDGEAPQRLRFVDGAPVVRLTVKAQRLSGIRTAPLKRITFRSGRQAYGEVVGIQSLLRLRAQHDMALAEQQVARARLHVSAQAYERLRGLNTQGDIISASRMRQSQFRRQTDQAQLTAAEMRVRNIHAQSLQRWGQELTDEALSDASSQMKRLISRKNVLLRITLNSDQHLPATARIAFIDSDGERRRARVASLVSAAPLADATSQGETWFFRMPVGDLRTGMRVAAWIPWDKAPAMAVLVPASAAIWYGGEPWVYIDAGKELFARHAVPTDHETAGGWVAREGFNPGEAVVVRGAQTLLSEEFRSQIPEEQDD